MDYRSGRLIGFLSLLAAFEDRRDVLDAGLAQVLFCRNELFLLFLADVVEVFVLQLGKALQPAGGPFGRRPVTHNSANQALFAGTGG